MGKEKPLFEIGSYKFVSVKNFPYLDSEINNQNDINPEIRKRIIVANCCYLVPVTQRHEL